jgi:tripartite-type tricarboxylate transporter receptor subunit TctC
MLKAESGFRFVHVPYKAIAQAITDVLGGQVESAFSSVPSVLATVAGGQVRAIAVTSKERIAVAPELPTIAESGYPTFDVNPWWGMLAPAGIDMALVRKTPEMQKLLAANGAAPLVSSPDAFLKMLEDDVAKWAKVVKAAGVHIN